MENDQTPVNPDEKGSKSSKLRTIAKTVAVVGSVFAGGFLIAKGLNKDNVVTNLGTTETE